MISVEQVRALEERIEKALSFIAALHAENRSLEGRLGEATQRALVAENRAMEAERRAVELEEAIATFRSEQARIEEGIIHALEKLDAFEDLVLRADSAARTEAVQPPAPIPASEASPAVTAQASSEAPAAPAAAPEEGAEGAMLDEELAELLEPSRPSAVSPLPAQPTASEPPSRPAEAELDIF